MTDLHSFSSSRSFFASLVSELSDFPKFQYHASRRSWNIDFVPTFPNSAMLTPPVAMFLEFSHTPTFPKFFICCTTCHAVLNFVILYLICYASVVCDQSTSMCSAAHVVTTLLHSNLSRLWILAHHKDGPQFFPCCKVLVPHLL